MSATTLAPTESPVEYVKALSPEAKEEVLLALLQELMTIRGDQGLISFTTPDGKPFGHYVSPAIERARSAAAFAEMPDDVRAKMMAPLPEDFDPDDVLTDDDLEAIRRRAGLQPR